MSIKQTRVCDYCRSEFAPAEVIFQVKVSIDMFPALPVKRKVVPKGEVEDFHEYCLEQAVVAITRKRVKELTTPPGPIKLRNYFAGDDDEEWEEDEIPFFTADEIRKLPFRTLKIALRQNDVDVPTTVDKTPLGSQYQAMLDWVFANCEFPKEEVKSDDYDK